MILSLWLENFRSYPRLRLEVPQVPLLFLVGPNGAGKTNLLEALSILGGGRGLRGATSAELTRKGSSGNPAWVVNAVLSKPPLRHNISQALKDDGRLARLDQKVTTGLRLGALLPTVALTPGEDALFCGPAEGRRTLLDRFVAARIPDHRGQVGAFTKALRERNALLRQAQQHGDKPEAAWLAALEELMASHGVALAQARRSYLAQLATAVAQGTGPFPAAGLALEGAMEANLETQSPDQVETSWRERWQAERPADLAAGRTLSGPHRSDLAVCLKEKAMPAAHCSTGEQKALLLSLFLGQARVLQAAGIRPLLLLDEVAAHLDAQRRAALMTELSALSAQIWMTGTEPEVLVPEGFADRSALFNLHQSSLVRSEVDSRQRSGD